MQNLRNLSYNNTILELQEKVFRRGINYSLNRLNDALNRLSSPHMNLPPTLHIAGTNGKGSVAHYLTQGLTQLGKRTITYTSPHIYDYTERFQINGAPISQERFAQLFNDVRVADPYHQLSEYEVLTLMALVLTQQESPECLILETGLGGRLDATNVVPFSYAIITDIGMDHMNLLGSSLTNIASEKAGIIKPNSVVFTQLDQPTDVVETIKARAKSQQATVHWVPPKSNIHERNKDLAIQVLTHLLNDPSEKIHRIIHHTNPPFGRLSPTTYQGVSCLMDVGHNAAAIERIFASSPPISEWIIGMQKTKDYNAVLTTLSTRHQRIKLCPFDQEMAVNHHDLPQEMQALIPNWLPGDPIAENAIFFGSFFFIDFLQKGHQYVTSTNTGSLHQ